MKLLHHRLQIVGINARPDDVDDVRGRQKKKNLSEITTEQKRPRSRQCCHYNVPVVVVRNLVVQVLSGVWVDGVETEICG